jgi:protein-tyrosine-phosphatase
MPSLLFVCTANVCRSPMATGIFIDLLNGQNAEWRVESAGTWAMDGEPVLPSVKQLLNKKGIDLGPHSSRSVSRELLQQFNLILTMESGHKEALRAEFPDLSSRVYLLSEMIGEVRDIRDPVGGSKKLYEDCLFDIELILTKGFSKVVQLASRMNNNLETLS